MSMLFSRAGHMARSVKEWGQGQSHPIQPHSIHTKSRAVYPWETFPEYHPLWVGQRQVLTSSGKGYFVNLWAVAAPHPFDTRKQMVWSNAIICATKDQQTILSQISSHFHSVHVYPRLWPLPEWKLCDSSCSNHTGYSTVCRLRPFHKNMGPKSLSSFCLIAFLSCLHNDQPCQQKSAAKRGERKANGRSPLQAKSSILIIQYSNPQRTQIIGTRSF